MTTTTKTPMGIRLFKLVTRVKDMFSDLTGSVNEETGEIDPEVVAAMELAELQGEAEVLDAACAVRELEEVEAAIQRQIDRLNARKKTLGNQQDYIRAMIEKAVEPGTKLSDERVTISWRRSTSVGVGCDVEELPKRFVRVKLEADKTAIGAALKAGKVVEGCALVEKSSLQIK